MKKFSNTDRAPDNSQGTMVARIGTHCPANGLWQSLESSTEAIFVFEGSIMPAHDGGSAMWSLVWRRLQIAGGRESRNWSWDREVTQKRRRPRYSPENQAIGAALGIA
ncbi:MULTISPECIES: hypothetical protein [Arthrobacter]|uniref:Uncharacterized protein n=1 Tax=Arthrobacter terricola TaxID=2547396 RepID=A0A4R5KDP1_9MICC|nr:MULTISPECIES: hypothetical protein [Arthrobacter]MBT8162320.1 hypothetical protein [Arthrobacter sp. GN70]TDF93421.1 hypothetical protein E1809_16395 [Arthrobacter terricola]